MTDWKQAPATDWRQVLADILPQVATFRRELHHHPELSGREAWTQAYITEQLTAMGIPCRAFADCHGVMAVLENGEGRCVAVRADMDALPVTEPEGLAFASSCPGVMHACGHDVHMALALGSALWLSQNCDKWHGTVKWLFEPQEETTGGGKLMVDQGCMENPRVDVVIGQHVNPRYPAGTFFSKPGFVSGSSDELLLTVRGKSCHGAYPEGGVDAIVIAAQLVCALQTLVSRTLSPFENAVLTLGTIQGGTANNIVCGEVHMTGTLRTLDNDTRRALHERMQRLCQSVAQGMGGEAQLTIRPSYGAVYNDEAAYAKVESAIARVMGPENIIRRAAPSLGVESFCYFLDHTPGVYYDIGSGVGTALHTPTFLVDEETLPTGLTMQCAAILALLEED